jgi:hypothetical protein
MCIDGVLGCDAAVTRRSRNERAGLMLRACFALCGIPRLDAALTDMTKDLVQRMKEIKGQLDQEPHGAAPAVPQQAAAADGDGSAAEGGSSPPSSSEREGLLDELTEILEHIDCAKGMP